MPASPKILIVDDDREVCQVFKVKFQQLNFDVSAAFEGGEAYQKTLQDPPDLILLDIRMPLGEDGLTFLRKLRGFRHDNPEMEAKVRKTPVVILSGAGEHMKSLFEIEGISDFLSKTLGLDEIRDRVLKVLPPK